MSNQPAKENGRMDSLEKLHESLKTELDSVKEKQDTLHESMIILTQEVKNLQKPGTSVMCALHERDLNDMKKAFGKLDNINMKLAAYGGAIVVIMFFISVFGKQIATKIGL